MGEGTRGGRPAPGRGKPGRFRYGIAHSLNARRRYQCALQGLYDWVESCVWALLALLLVFVFLLRVVTVSGPSMLPALRDGDRLLLMQAGRADPAHGQIVVIDRTRDGRPPIIKRVIGVGGDTIDIDFDSGDIRRNGRLLDERYLSEPTRARQDVVFPVTVPDGAVFVLGDNRNHSLDSRASEVGMVDLRRVMGRAVFRLTPVGAAGPLGPWEREGSNG